MAIPVLDKFGAETGEIKKTLADTLLPEYDKDLAITIYNGEQGMLVPVWRFIERYLRITDTHGKLAVFELKKSQIDFYIEACKLKRQGKPIRINTLKARQLGFSTLIAAIIFTLTVFAPGQEAVIIADKAEHATNLFNKYKFFYEMLPAELKALLPKKTGNAKEVAIDYGDGQTSSIRIIVQGDSAGRSGTKHHLHLSEAAFWGDITGTLTSVLQTVDDNNPNSLIVIETTANGVNEYKRLWDMDVAEGIYKALFFPWFVEPRYQTTAYDFKNELEDWEIELQKEHNLTDAQMNWYHKKYLDLRKDKDRLKQEYPSTPIEAFITSGNSVFNTELLHKRKLEIMELDHEEGYLRGEFTYTKKFSLDGSRIDVTNIEFREDPSGYLKIYKEPNPLHPYVVSNDPAMGGDNYFVIQVFDNYTGEQVAIYRRNRCGADGVAFQMYCLAKYYNEALITGETNTTSYLLDICYRAGYRNIYQDQDFEDLTGRYQNKLGYKTKTNNRQAMIEFMKRAFEEDYQCIRDYQTVVEMEQFQVVKHTRRNTTTEKIEAISGGYDDCVSAALGFYYCRHAQRATPYTRAERPKALDITNPFYIHEHLKKQEQNNKGNYLQLWD